MISLSGRRVVFVTNRLHLSDRPGGVQSCSREYLNLLQATGLNIDVVRIDVDRRLPVRFLRRLRRSPYVGPVSPLGLKNIYSAMENADLLFLNQVNLAGAIGRDSEGRRLAEKTILLSHGAEITDLLHQARVPERAGLRMPRSSWGTVNRVLHDEVRSRDRIAGAICLSPYDADFEKWLGVKQSIWVPRTVNSFPLNWRPVSGNFGFLGTLNHTPNLEGLIALLEEMNIRSHDNVSVRIVGGPEDIGRWLQQRYKNAIYLGPLGDDELRKEAATWNAFLNPVFCQARGCSTKLATGLAWEIPIITSAIGMRGYVQLGGAFTIADTPQMFLNFMTTMADPNIRERMYQAIVDLARSTPSTESHVERISAFIASIIADSRRDYGN